NDKLQSEFLGLVWKGHRIDHAGNEHDDYSAAVARLANVLQDGAGAGSIDDVHVGGGFVAGLPVTNHELGSGNTPSPWPGRESAEHLFGTPEEEAANSERQKRGESVEDSEIWGVDRNDDFDW